MITLCAAEIYFVEGERTEVCNKVYVSWGGQVGERERKTAESFLFRVRKLKAMSKERSNESNQRSFERIHRD